jgi:hypothetical protein
MKNWEQIAIAGFIMFVTGIVWNVRYSWLQLAAPAHTYDGPILVGGFITAAGVVTAVVGLRGYQGGR